MAVPQAIRRVPLTLLAGPIAPANRLQVMHLSLAAGLAAAWAQTQLQTQTPTQDGGLLAAVVAGLAFGLAPALTLGRAPRWYQMTTLGGVLLAPLAAVGVAALGDRLPALTRGAGSPAPNHASTFSRQSLRPKH